MGCPGGIICHWLGKLSWGWGPVPVLWGGCPCAGCCPTAPGWDHCDLDARGTHRAGKGTHGFLVPAWDSFPGGESCS